MLQRTGRQAGCGQLVGRPRAGRKQRAGRGVPSREAGGPRREGRRYFIAGSSKALQQWRGKEGGQPCGELAELHVVRRQQAAAHSAAARCPDTWEGLTKRCHKRCQRVHQAAGSAICAHACTRMQPVPLSRTMSMALPTHSACSPDSGWLCVKSSYDTAFAASARHK